MGQIHPHNNVLGISKGCKFLVMMQLIYALKNYSRSLQVTLEGDSLFTHQCRLATRGQFCEGAISENVEQCPPHNGTTFHRCFEKVDNFVTH